MKLKSSATAFLLLIVLSVNAQMATGFIRAGANLANVTTGGGANYQSKPLISFQFGFIGNVPITPNIAFQPGLLFTGKGTKSQSGSTGDDTYYRATSNPYYIEIPANILVKTGSSGYTRFFAGAGPYLGIGIAGKVKSDGKILGSSFQSEKNIEWSNQDPAKLNSEENAGFGVMRRFDYGLNGTIGIETLFAVISVNYGFGIANLQNSPSDNKHRVISLTVGFRNMFSYK